MKTEYKNSLLVIAISMLAIGLLSSITLIGIEERDPLKIWFAPVAVAVLLSFWAVGALRDLSFRWWYERRLELRKTGVLDFISAASLEEDMMRILLNNNSLSAEARVNLLVKKIEDVKGRSITVRGVVCDEEIVGVVDGMFLTVTVTKPETAKAFRKIPKHLRKYVTVIDLSKQPSDTASADKKS